MKNFETYMENHFRRIDSTKNLENLVEVLGYGHGWMRGRALEEFLEDNPGAIQAILEFIETHMNEEWDHSIQEFLMVSKLGSQFGKLFDEYKNVEDDSVKSEKGFVDYLKDEEVNKLARLVSKTNRSKEIDNVVTLFNILDEEILHLWDFTKPKSDQTQIRLKRLIRSKSIMSWSEILKDAIAAKLDIFDADEKALLFYRELNDIEFQKIREIVRRLVDWSVWKLPENSEIDRILLDNKSEIKKYFRTKGLTTGYLMGAPE